MVNRIKPSVFIISSICFMRLRAQRSSRRRAGEAGGDVPAAGVEQAVQGDGEGDVEVDDAEDFGPQGGADAGGGFQIDEPLEQRRSTGRHPRGGARPAACSAGRRTHAASAGRRCRSHWTLAPTEAVALGPPPWTERLGPGRAQPAAWSWTMAPLLPCPG